MAKRIADRFIQRKPGKGDADYVPHPVIRQFLLLVCDDHREAVIREHVTTDDKGRQSVACLVRLEVCVDGAWYGPWEEWGESENYSAPFKSAHSDAIKRLAAMHLGIGLHLWAQGHYFLDRALADRAIEAADVVAEDAEPAIDDGIAHDEIPAAATLPEAAAGPPPVDPPPAGGAVGPLGLGPSDNIRFHEVLKAIDLQGSAAADRHYRACMEAVYGEEARQVDEVTGEVRYTVAALPRKKAQALLKALSPRRTRDGNELDDDRCRTFIERGLELLAVRAADAAREAAQEALPIEEAS